MARPRVFVSSTYYDLKHLRSALEGFIDSLGFEAVLSEKGSIAYAPDHALDESCYREAQQSDLMVLIVGGRYGSERSGDHNRDNEFFTRYDSITRQEFRTAIENKVPLYVLIEKAVHAEYQTFLKNRESNSINYAHVDSINVFKMIDEILTLPKNNPVFAFDRFHDIQTWLREQWSGLFRELLRRMSTQEQMATLAAQVTQLTETNKTLQRYLESLITHVSPNDSAALIEHEAQRLRDVSRYDVLRDNPFVNFALREGVHILEIGPAIENSESLDDLANRLTQKRDPESHLVRILREIHSGRHDYAVKDINEARNRLNKPPLPQGTGFVAAPTVIEPPISDSIEQGKKPSGKKPSGKKPSGKKPSGKKPSGKKPSGKKAVLNGEATV